MRNLGQYQKFLSRLTPHIVKKIDFLDEGFSDILGQHDKLVVACRHSTALSWAPVIMALTEACVAGGHGDRVPVGIVDRRMYQIPIWNRVANYIAQGAPKNFDEVVAVMGEHSKADFVVFPEGSNCFFGDPSGVQEFISTRFIEMAIRMNVPILLVNHRGSESWAEPMDLGHKVPWAFKAFGHLMPRALVNSQMIGLPTLPKPLEKLELWTKLYIPKATLAELDADGADHKQILREDVDVIREFYSQNRLLD